MKTEIPIFKSENKLFAETSRRIHSVLCCNNDSVRYYAKEVFGYYHAGIMISFISWSMIGQTNYISEPSDLYAFLELDQYFFEMADLLQ